MTRLSHKPMIPQSLPSASRGRRRTLSILGSTGSIGCQTLEIVRLFPEAFDVAVLTAYSNAELLARQALEFRPRLAVIMDEHGVGDVRRALAGTDIVVAAGQGALHDAAALPEADIVMAAVVGFAGLGPVLSALEAGKTVALANKETLVVGGEIVGRCLHESGGTLIPVDSEHSAIFQCLVGEDISAVEELVLTASGGPFRDRDQDTLHKVTVGEALAHPNWSMGDKITIDSATMMNKGLEVIEARWLFGLSADKIRVLVHPQSIVHSMVAFRDGSVKAQLGVPDMKVPIQYALTFPERWEAPHDRPDWTAIGNLEFFPPDTDRFPCLRLAYDALRLGGAAPAVLNAANEAAVDLFLKEEIRFTDIPILIERCLDACGAPPTSDLESLVEIDRKARRVVAELNRSAVH